MRKVEEQLAEYRNKKQLSGASTTKSTDSLGKLLEKFTPDDDHANENPRNLTNNDEEIPEFIQETAEENSAERTWNQRITSFLIQLLVWLVLLMAAVKMEFGMVYCILTGFYVIWINLSSRKKRRNEQNLSAYSVFNPNLERLPGTMTAEQIEGELLHRPVAR